MLVLARKVNESITIGDDVVIKVIGVEGMQVRLGIDAPRNVRVLRQEVYEKIREENLLSARGEAGAFIKAAGLLNTEDRSKK
ncbi:MAG: carbon storage regulator CsrA [Desulfatiglandaceae bacterium]|jgi:carbon storage regulator